MLFAERVVAPFVVRLLEAVLVGEELLLDGHEEVELGHLIKVLRKKQTLAFIIAP